MSGLEPNDKEAENASLVVSDGTPKKSTFKKSPWVLKYLVPFAMKYLALFKTMKTEGDVSYFDQDAIRDLTPINIEYPHKKMSQLQKKWAGLDEHLPGTMYEAFSTGTSSETYQASKMQAIQKNLTDLCSKINSGFALTTQSLKSPKPPSQNLQYFDIMMAEILSKQLAFTENIDGKTIPLPVKIGDEYKLVEYSIKQHTFGDSLPYFVLEPTPAAHAQYPDAKPWVVVRGTHLGDSMGAKESVFADVADKKNIDMSASDIRYTEIHQEFERLRATYTGGIQVSGYSLGGAVAQQWAVEHCDAKDVVIALDPPGVSKKTVAEFDAMDGGGKPNVFCLCGANDVVPKAGEKHLGNVYQYTEGSDKNPLHNHLSMHFFPDVKRQITIQKVSAKEYSSVSRVLTNSIRNTGRRIVNWVLAKAKPVWTGDAKVSIKLSDSQNLSEKSSADDLPNTAADPVKSRQSDQSVSADRFFQYPRAIAMHPASKASTNDGPAVLIEGITLNALSELEMNFKGREYNYSIGTTASGGLNITVKPQSKSGKEKSYTFEFKKMQDDKNQNFYVLQKVTIQKPNHLGKTLSLNNPKEKKRATKLLKVLVNQPMKHGIDSKKLPQKPKKK